MSQKKDKKDGYEPRYVAVTNKDVTKNYTTLQKLQKRANPKIDRYNEIEEKTNELKKPLNEYREEVKDEVKDITEYLDGINAKASKLKEKITPMLIEQMEGKLGEFEYVGGVEMKKNVLHIVIRDRVEEYKTALRNQNQETAKVNKSVEETAK